MYPNSFISLYETTLNSEHINFNNEHVEVNLHALTSAPEIYTQKKFS